MICTLCFVQLLYFVYLCVTVSFIFLFLLKGHRKSLSEPGVFCSTSMSLVCIATALVFEQIKWWWRWWKSKVSRSRYYWVRFCRIQLIIISMWKIMPAGTFWAAPSNFLCSQFVTSFNVLFNRPYPVDRALLLLINLKNRVYIQVL